MKTKSFQIPKRVVWEAYKLVRAKGGAGGVDGESIEEFEQDVENNLYKLWNRMSSGSYFPGAVLGVDLVKSTGGVRRLGIPTVRDRIAQMVVKLMLEPELESEFDSSSYGFRPRRSAHQALSQARRNCWRHDWVLDVDIERFFDTLDHAVLMKALRRHTESRWILLYVQRWLTAPMQGPEGEMLCRERGTPQGGVISPLLANLYLHYVFDRWMRQAHRSVKFVRYADDIVCHCDSEEQAQVLLCSLQQRLARYGLKLHPGKTQIVYCRDSQRRGTYHRYTFTFLGYDFRPRLSRTRQGRRFVNFSAGVSRAAVTTMNWRMRRWRSQRWSAADVDELYDKYSSVLRGWMRYYSLFHDRALEGLQHRWRRRLIRWVLSKYKGLRHRVRHAVAWWNKQVLERPKLGWLWNPLNLAKG